MTFAERHGRTWTEDDRAAVMGANSARLGTDHARAARPRHARAPTSSERSWTPSSSAIGARAPRPSTARSTRSAGSRAHLPVAVASSAHRRGHRGGARGDRPQPTSFAVVVSSDEVAHGKPAPDVYLETARRLGVEPAGAASSSRIRSTASGPAKAAGMTVVLVPNRERPAGARDGRARRRRHRPSRRARSGADRAGRATPAARADDRDPSRPTALPGPAISPIRRTIRYWVSRGSRGGGRAGATCGSISRIASGCRRAPPSTASTT